MWSFFLIATILYMVLTYPFLPFIKFTCHHNLCKYNVATINPLVTYITKNKT